MASSLTAFTHTNYFRSDIPQYRGIRTVVLIPPTHDTRDLVSAACRIITQVFKLGYAYVKAAYRSPAYTTQLGDVPKVKAL